MRERTESFALEKGDVQRERQAERETPLTFGVGIPEIDIWWYRSIFQGEDRFDDAGQSCGPFAMANIWFHLFIGL